LPREGIFTEEELTVGAIVGGLREVSALTRERPSGYGYDESTPWERHINGAFGEMAVAKETNKYWQSLSFRSGLREHLPGDVGAVQVRATTHLGGRLIVHPDEPDNALFVLVTLNLPSYSLVGWKLGSEAKQQRYWDDPGTGRPAYFIPQADLSLE